MCDHPPGRVIRASAVTQNKSSDRSDHQPSPAPRHCQPKHIYHGDTHPAQLNTDLTKTFQFRTNIYFLKGAEHFSFCLTLPESRLAIY